MSHFTEVKTKITNRETLKKALKKLGHEVVEGSAGVEVRGYFGATQPADFKILTNSNYDIGFRLGEDGNYELVGDWELMPKVADIEQDAFTKTLKREYAHQTILEVAQKMGYSVDYLNTENEDGQLELSVKQWSAT